MLSVTESANLLGVSASRVRALIASGEIKATKIGGSWALEEAEVMNRLISKPKPGRPRLSSLDEGAMCEIAKDEGVNSSRLAEARKLYMECKKALSGCPSPCLLQSAESSEEADFYVAVSDFFLQQEQRRLVKNGVF